MYIENLMKADEKIVENHLEDGSTATVGLILL